MAQAGREVLDRDHPVCCIPPNPISMSQRYVPAMAPPCSPFLPLLCRNAGPCVRRRGAVGR
jgi:hypothetical protein